eukprot:jgi/Undpi1/13646/HiC_scaffold_9.g03300.m1
MLATRPSSSEGVSGAQAEELSAAAPQEEKRIPGVKQDSLKEERKPLLDLDDVEQLESELAACFDAPPPPPLNIEIDREEATATVSEWTPAAEPRYLDNRYVAPHAPSLSTTARRGEQQQQQQQQATRVSDYSSLYSPPTNLAVSSSRQNLYPALVPTAPSADVARTNSRGAWAQSATGQVVERGAANQASGGNSTAEVDPAVASRKQGGSVAAAEARERGGAAAGAAAAAVAAKVGNAPVQVVEELLSENERLRLIIQDMSEELDRVTFQLNEGAEAVVREESGATGEATQTLAQALARDPASRTTASAASASASSALTRYPGAEAEARRRQREAGGQQSDQQQEEQEQGTDQEQVLRRGIFVHFKCDNCPQWLKVPGHAQLVYCPTCGHTSQMTSGSTIHFPRNNQIPQAAGSENAAASSAAAADAGEGVGWLGYIKSVLAS